MARPISTVKGQGGPFARDDQGWWPAVITLTRLSGSVFALNSDLIERIDATPDTVITLVDGTKYIVLEDLATVVSAVREYRGAVIAESARLSDQDPTTPAAAPQTAGRVRRLQAVTDHSRHAEER